MDETRAGVASGLAAGILILVLTAMALTSFQTARSSVHRTSLEIIAPVSATNPT